MNPGNLLSYEFKGLYETIDAFIELQKEFFQPCIRVIVNAKKQRFSGDYEADYLVDCYVICDTISACIKGINNKLKEGIL